MTPTHARAQYIAQLVWHNNPTFCVAVAIAVAVAVAVAVITMTMYRSCTCSSAAEETLKCAGARLPASQALLRNRNTVTVTVTVTRISYCRVTP